MLRTENYSVRLIFPGVIWEIQTWPFWDTLYIVWIVSLLSYRIEYELEVENVTVRLSGVLQIRSKQVLDRAFSCAVVRYAGCPSGMESTDRRLYIRSCVERILTTSRRDLSKLCVHSPAAHQSFSASITPENVFLAYTSFPTHTSRAHRYWFNYPDGKRHQNIKKIYSRKVGGWVFSYFCQHLQATGRAKSAGNHVICCFLSKCSEFRCEVLCVYVLFTPTFN